MGNQYSKLSNKQSCYCNPSIKNSSMTSSIDANINNIINNNNYEIKSAVKSIS